MNTQRVREVADFILEHPERYDQTEIYRSDSPENACCVLGIAKFLYRRGDASTRSSTKIPGSEALGVQWSSDGEKLFLTWWPIEWADKAGIERAQMDSITGAYGESFKPTAKQAHAILHKMADDKEIWE